MSPRTIVIVASAAVMAFGGCCVPVGVVGTYLALAPAAIPEEEIVKRYVLERANDPKAVEFAQWGPHVLKDAHWGRHSLNVLLTGADLRRMIAPHLDVPPLVEKIAGADDRRPAKLLRLCYRTRNQAGAVEFRDHLFVIQDGAVVQEFVNGWGGDHWADSLKGR